MKPLQLRSNRRMKVAAFSARRGYALAKKAVQARWRKKR
jgi:hypothetical protein